MRFAKLKNNFSWKYIIGEVLLIFIGINLAIWFNNWNASNKSTRALEVAIEHIKEEIKSNIDELSEAQKENQLILEAYTEYKKIYAGNSNELITDPAHLQSLKAKYPDFFRVADSLIQESGLFYYRGSTYIDLQLPELTQIAWETSRTVGITNKINYECLYELESMYNLQLRVQTEIDKAANALQRRSIEELMNILDFLEQLSPQLEMDYKNMLDSIDQCR